MLPKKCSGQFSRLVRGICLRVISPSLIDQTASRLTKPCPAPPRRAPPRPDKPAVSGFGFERLQENQGLYKSSAKPVVGLQSYQNAAMPCAAYQSTAEFVANLVFFEIPCAMLFEKNNLSNPKPGHTTGWSGRGGARPGGEGGRGWVGQNAFGSTRPGDNPPSCQPANRDTALDVFSSARTNETQFKPMGARNQRLTRG